MLRKKISRLEHFEVLKKTERIAMSILLQIWKTKQTKKPDYIYSNLQATNTRSSVDGNFKIPARNTALASRSFMVRAVLHWNQTPPEIRNCNTLNSLKKNLKEYVKQNVPLA